MLSRGLLEVKEQQKSKLDSEAPKFQPYAPTEPGFSREMKPQSYLQLSSLKISKSVYFSFTGSPFASLPATCPTPDLHSKIFVFQALDFLLNRISPAELPGGF